MPSGLQCWIMKKNLTVTATNSITTKGDEEWDHNQFWLWAPIVCYVPVVGTVRMASGAATAVRARIAGATSVVGRRIAKVPRGLRAVTAQRAVPTWNSATMHS
jgi:hypothetical protein